MFSKQISIILLCFLPAFVFAQMGVEKAEDWKKLEKDGYSIEYPANWDLDESGQMNTSFVLLSLQEDPLDQFQENVNLLIQDLTGMGIDLDKFTELSLAQLKVMIEDSEVIESKAREANGRQFHSILHKGKQSGFDLTFYQYYWIENEKAYVLTLTTETKKFEKFNVVGTQILDSFMFQ